MKHINSIDERIIQNRKYIYLTILIYIASFAIHSIFEIIDWWEIRFLRNDVTLQKEFIQNYQKHFKKAAEASLTKIVSANRIMDIEPFLQSNSYNDPLLNPTLIVPKLPPDKTNWNVSKFDDQLILGILDARWNTNNFENSKIEQTYKIFIKEYYQRELGKWKLTKVYMDVNLIFYDEDF